MKALASNAYNTGLRKFIDVESADLLQRLSNANSIKKVEFVSLRAFCLDKCYRKKIDPNDLTLLNKTTSLQRKIIDKYNELIGDGAKIKTVSELNIHTENKFIACLKRFNEVLFVLYDERPFHREKEACFDFAYAKMMCTYMAERDYAIAHLCLGLSSTNFIKLNCPPLVGLGEEQLNHLKIAASMGNINASYYLGLASKDPVEQMQSITQAADNGHVGALVQAALLHRKNDNREQAVKYLETAYEKAFKKAPIAKALSDLYIEMDQSDIALQWSAKVHAGGLTHSNILDKGPTLNRSRSRS